MPQALPFSNGMKLVCINIELNKHREKVLDFLKKEKPDVICLQELLESDFERFKNELNMEGVFELFYVLSLTREPDRPELNGQKYGVAIFSKKIFNSGVNFYVGTKENILKPLDKYFENKENTKNNVFVWVDIENKKGEKFKFITTHLPVTKNGEVTDFQLKNIPEFVICGDTNAPRGREAFDKMAKVYKDNIPKKYKTSIDQNLHRVKGIQFMVDCLFSTPGYTAKDVKLVDGVSDHIAIVADIEKAKSLLNFPKRIVKKLASKLSIH